MRFSEVGGEAGRILREHFRPAFRPGHVTVQPAEAPSRLAVTMPTRFTDLGPQVRDLDVHDQDVWVVSFPKTGQRHVTSPCSVRLLGANCIPRSGLST